MTLTQGREVPSAERCGHWGMSPPWTTVCRSWRISSCGGPGFLPPVGVQNLQMLFPVQKGLVFMLSVDVDQKFREFLHLSGTEVEFGRGLNILTGETGAGKSLLLGSVNLALGGKFEKDMLRKGKESALVTLQHFLSPSFHPLLPASPRMCSLWWNPLFPAAPWPPAPCGRGGEERYVRVLREALSSAEAAGNILVLKTASGMAMAAASPAEFHLRLLHQRQVFNM